MIRSNPERSYTEKYWLAIITLILFGAYAFRLWNLGTQSLWHDEAWSVFQAYTPLKMLDPNYPPAYTLFLGGWIRLAGDEVWTMRYFTLLFGVLTVAAVTLGIRRWFSSQASILAALLIAVSPTLWVYSQEVRSYVVMPIFTFVLLILVDRLTRPQKTIPRRTWIWLLLAEILALYSHNLGVPLTAWLNVTVGAIWLWRREWKRLGAWLLAQVGLLVLYLPWLATQKPTGTALNTPPKFGLDLLWQIWQSYFSGIKAMISADNTLMALTALFGVISVIGIILALWLRSQRRTWLLLSQVILLPTFELIIILAAHIDFHPRYFLLGVVPTLALVAVGYAELTRVQQRASILRPAIQIGMIILALAVTVRMAQALYSNPAFQHDQFRTVAEHYAQLGPDDAIIIPYGWEPTIDYYSLKMNFKAKFVSIPLHSNVETIMGKLDAELKDVNRVEFLTWFQLPADVRGAYPCLLSTTRKRIDLLGYSGISTTSYDAPSPIQPIVQKSMLNNVTYQLDAPVIKRLDAQTISGPYAMCVLTRWQLESPTKTNWSAAVRVNVFTDNDAASAWEIARSDTLLLNDNQVATSLWKAGAIETSFSLLNLPDGAVGDHYSVSATIYGDPKPSGLDAFADGKPLGLTPEIGPLEVVAVPDVSTASPTGQSYKLSTDLSVSAAQLPDPQSPDLHAGSMMRISLRWQQTGNLPLDTQIKLVGDGWDAVATYRLDPVSVQLAWYTLTVPANAKGKAILEASSGNSQPVKLGEYDFGNIDRIFTAPTIGQAVNASFTGVGVLTRFDVPDSVKNGQSFPITLVWNATTTPTVSYTVFVHLLDSSGQVVAQSDALPVSGNRPTTGWIGGEIVTDTPTLSFTKNYSGPATIEVGLYDAATQTRVKTEDGSDHVVLPVQITVQP